MEQLSFGEQLKVILSRRGMTIKALAELIEERTGKKMSRQNLTQRLGRDNFQEQDMRLIAEILGCPFTLNILTVEEGPESENEGLAGREKEVGRERAFTQIQVKTKEEPKEQSRFIAEDQFEELDHSISREPIGLAKEVKGRNIDSIQESSEDLISKLEDDIEGMDDVEEIDDAEDIEGVDEELDDENYVTVGDLRDMNQELTDLEKEARFRSKGIFLRVKGVDVDQSQIDRDDEERPRRKGLSQDTQEFAKEDVQTEESGFREVQQGEINPYTGREYETNSVRTHPSRIGYVQVYDRGIHRWKDMTEWAFLGYQERKKAILGSRYEEPIYLD